MILNGIMTADAHCLGRNWLTSVMIKGSN